VGAQGRIGAKTFAGSGIIESFLKMLDPVIAATHWILTAIVILSIVIMVASKNLVKTKRQV